MVPILAYLDRFIHGRYLFRNETLTGLQLVGSLITLVSICFIKVEKPKDTKPVDPLKEALYDAVPADATV